MLEKSEVCFLFGHTILRLPAKPHSSSHWQFAVLAWVLRASRHIRTRRVQQVLYAMLCDARELTRRKIAFWLDNRLDWATWNLPFLILYTCAPLHTAHLHFQNGMGKTLLLDGGDPSFSLHICEDSAVI